MRAHCVHSTIYHDTCDNARKNTAWVRPDEDARLAAATVRRIIPTKGPNDAPRSSSFPGPVVMPDDALAIEPDQEPQPLSEYLGEDCRNRVTPQRNVIYVFDAPAIATELAAKAGKWQNPVLPPSNQDEAPPVLSQGTPRPSVDRIAAYVEAFYSGMAMRVIKSRFRLVPWRSRKRGTGAETEEHIGFESLASPESPSSITRIRCRPSGDKIAPQAQLNLDDLLDGLLEVLPSDAYAAMLLMHHDLYEDEEDDFCCGRAYGASRICVISTFRYHPKLGPYEGIAPHHTWPNSHCREYIDDVWACTLEDPSHRTSSKRLVFDEDRMLLVPDLPRYDDRDTALEKVYPEPIMAAIQATRQITAREFTLQDWEDTWLARACVVTVHELGHCFGLDHCLYYACVMQGTASVAEDTQQPPYLCPVYQAKVAYTVGIEPVPTRGRRRRSTEEMRKLEKQWTMRQYAALREYCDRRKGGVMFPAFVAWLQSRMKEVEGVHAGSRELRTREPSEKQCRSATYLSDLVED